MLALERKIAKSSFSKVQIMTRMYLLWYPRATRTVHYDSQCTTPCGGKGTRWVISMVKYRKKLCIL